MLSNKRILILDDHRLFLEGLRHLLSDLEEHVELELVTDAKTAIARISQRQAYVLLIVDLSMPDMDGFSFLQSVLKRKMSTPILVLSSTQSIADVKRAMSLGALGFVRKTASSDEMLLAVRQVLLGNIYLPDDLWNLIDVYPAFLSGTALQATESIDSNIGARQLEVLKLIVDGLSNKNIAAVLDIREPTVKYHVSILFKHFGVKSRTALIMKTRDFSVPNTSS